MTTTNPTLIVDLDWKIGRREQLLRSGFAERRDARRLGRQTTAIDDRIRLWSAELRDLKASRLAASRRTGGWE